MGRGLVKTDKVNIIRVGKEEEKSAASFPIFFTFSSLSVVLSSVNVVNS